ncbi:MAG: hypothetical protein ABIH82_02670 [Candidatus Woesearchaeota archaeon]
MLPAQSEGYETNRRTGFFAYPSDYIVKPISEQVAILEKLLPGLNSQRGLNVARDLPSAPNIADGWGVFPKYSRVGEVYATALSRVLNILQEQRPELEMCVPDYCFEPGNTVLTDRTRDKLTSIESKFSGDYVVYPFQSGKRFAIEDIPFADDRGVENEFDLDPLAVVVLLLTHPERLSSMKDLKIDCMGAELFKKIPGPHSVFFNDERICSYFTINMPGGQFKFMPLYGYTAHSQFGIATGFEV